MAMRRHVGWGAVGAALVLLTACSQDPPPAPPPPPPATPAAAPPTQPTPPPVAAAPATRPAPPVPAVGLPPAPDPTPPAPPAAAPPTPPAAPTVAMGPVPPAETSPAPVPPAASGPSPPPPAAAPAPPPAPPKPFEWPLVIDGKSLDDYTKLFASDDPAVRESTGRTVVGFGPAARKPALKPLLAMLKSSDPGLRVVAIDSLAALAYEKPEQKEVVEALTAGLRSDSAGSVIRFHLVRALNSYGPAAAGAVPVLVGPVHSDPWWETRRETATALGAVGQPVYRDPPDIDPIGRWVPDRPASEPAQACLRRMLLHDPSAAVRMAAVFSLYTIGAPYAVTPAEYAAKSAANYDAVTARLKGGVAGKEKVKAETEKAVRIWLYVLQMMYDDREIKEKDTLLQLANYLQDPEFVARGQALNAIATLGPRAVAVLPQVRDFLSLYKDEPQLVASALGCLTQMGPDAAGVIPDVEKCRDEAKDAGVKRLADATIQVLKGLKKAAPPGAKPADPAMPGPAK